MAGTMIRCRLPTTLHLDEFLDQVDSHAARSASWATRTRTAVGLVRAAAVGWVELRETHQYRTHILCAIAADHKRWVS